MDVGVGEGRRVLGLSYIPVTTRQPNKVNLTLNIIILIYVVLSSPSLIKERKKKNLQLTMKYFPALLSRHPPNAVHDLIMEPTGWTLEMKRDVSAAVRNEIEPTAYSHHSSPVRLN